MQLEMIRELRKIWEMEGEPLPRVAAMLAQQVHGLFDIEDLGEAPAARARRRERGAVQGTVDGLRLTSRGAHRQTHDRPQRLPRLGSSQTGLAPVLHGPD